MTYSYDHVSRGQGDPDAFASARGMLYRTADDVDSSVRVLRTISQASAWRSRGVEALHLLIEQFAQQLATQAQVLRYQASLLPWEVQQ
ncbi:hypothetical protein [Microbacterium sp. YY-01]|uniref:hypothetical protein n=1 Tax=Microbacterium sp. YY-01 TaxID=3421634 RepID=UPI003D16F53F